MIIAIIVSALLYAMSFMGPSLWWFIFFFTTPLTNVRLKVSHGFLWGIIAFGLHTSGVLDAVMELQQGMWCIRFVSSVSVVCFLAACSALWIMIRGYAYARRSKRTMPLPFFLSLPFIDALFFYFLSYALLLPLGLPEGYPLANPLLPLMAAPGAPRIIGALGMFGSLYYACMPGVVAYYATMHHTTRSLWAIALLVPWLLPSLYFDEVPSWVAQVYPIRLQWPTRTSSTAPWEMIRSIIHTHPHKKIFITPESSLYNPEAINVTHIYNESLKRIILIIGSFSTAQERRYNTLFCISQGILSYTHHKQHALCMIEQVPSWCASAWLCNLYNTQNGIERAPFYDDHWTITENIIFEPYTCSEFFCRTTPRSSNRPDATLLVCCNDSFFSGWRSYVAQLMLADARLKAVLWHKQCLYIGYRHTGFISHTGCFFPLNIENFITF